MKNLGQYIVSHKWSKDILRGNFLYIILAIFYDLLHFNLSVIDFHWAIRCWFLMNICLLINTGWNWVEDRK